MLLEKERELLVEYGKKMSAAGLSSGTSGNLSIYNPEAKLMAITPSGIGYFDTVVEDIVVTDLEANIVEGTKKPSSEWALHTAFYKNKPECRAVVHVHSRFCTTFAALNQPIRAVHYVIGDAGVATVPCAPYRTFGSMELALEAVEVCGEGNAVLLANHGLITCGDSLKGAYGLACNMEFIAEIQYRAMSIGQPVVLSDQEMEHVMNEFKHYGQAKKPGEKQCY